ncbi:hypothetical protein GLOIN_2v709189 [Rhizophagus clarus]|uniref:HMG box domain-containing protein n=1 Tax=Rhizophagus clarus TaxID=94130 RepID=A0A8H3MCR9_9GLOM|nr:hypothetical protein GLOIN_2v709189 [Rhizophagus clarus]
MAKSKKSKNPRPLIKPKVKKSGNSYFIFKTFTTRTFETDYINLNQQEKNKKIGKFWNYIPNELKNGFYKYANRERILKSLVIQGNVNNYVYIKQSFSENIIFDDLCLNSLSVRNKEYDSNCSNNINNDEVYDRMFNEFINTDQLLKTEEGDICF